MSAKPLHRADAARSDAAPAAQGAVVAANALAAQAGEAMLRQGGNAADAAVAIAAALSVVDPANCGIGGFGGFAVIDEGGAEPQQVAFNARVPARFQAVDLASAPAGMKVSPPAVVAGLCALQGRFGRMSPERAWAPAIRFAREGFRVSKDLATALEWAASSHPSLNDAFRDVFFRDGAPLREGDRLVQPRLASTLEAIAHDGALAAPPIVDSICGTVAEAGGCIGPSDFRIAAQVMPAVARRFEEATVYAAEPDQCGAGILFTALEALDGEPLGEARSRAYVTAVGGALANAWRERNAAWLPLARAPSQTTHLSVADGDGRLVAMTFTHGPSWFGSGLLDAASGVLLNTGASIFVRRASDGAVVAQPNLAPSVVRSGDGRYALGSPGGRHIPAIVLQAVIDLVHYRAAPERVLGAARLSASASGAIDAEAELRAAFPDLVRRQIAREEYYGPAGMIAWKDGGARAHCDPRFDGACIHVA